MPEDRSLHIVAFLLLAALGWILWPVAVSILIGGLIALIAQRPFRWLERTLHGRRAAAAGLATSVIVIIVFLPLGAMIWLTIDESLAARPWLNEALADQGRFLQGLATHLPQSLRAVLPGLSKALLDAAVGLVGRLSQLAPQLLSSIGWIGVELFLTIVTLFYFFKEGPAFVRLVRRVMPLREAQTSALINEFEQVAFGLFWGSLITSGFQGLSAAIGYWIFGITQIGLFGMLTAVAAFIPLVGTAVIWLPLVIGLWLHGKIFRALGLALWCLVIVSVGDNFLRPFVSKGRMAMPRALLLLTLFGGLQLLGARGLLLGPLVGSLAVTAINLMSRSPMATTGRARSTGSTRMR